MNRKRKLFTAVSILMIIIGILMVPVCMYFASQASTDTSYRNAGIGCVIAAVINMLMAVIGSMGYSLRNRTEIDICVVAAYILLFCSFADAVILKPYAVFTLPFVLVLCTLYIIGSKVKI